MLETRTMSLPVITLKRACCAGWNGGDSTWSQPVGRSGLRAWFIFSPGPTAAPASGIGRTSAAAGHNAAGDRTAAQSWELGNTARITQCRIPSAQCSRDRTRIQVVSSQMPARVARRQPRDGLGQQRRQGRVVVRSSADRRPAAGPISRDRDGQGQAQHAFAAKRARAIAARLPSRCRLRHRAWRCRHAGLESLPQVLGPVQRQQDDQVFVRGGRDHVFPSRSTATAPGQQLVGGQCETEGAAVRPPSAARRRRRCPR